MTTVQHASIADAYLHEPKGIAAAAANKVYVSNGAASGAWSTVPTAAIASANALGAWKMIGSYQTASSSATIDFTSTSHAAAFDGTYDHVKLVVTNAKPATDDVEPWLRIGTGAGPTWQTTIYNFGHTAVLCAASGAYSAGWTSESAFKTSYRALANDVGNNTFENLSGEYTFDKLSSSDYPGIKYSVIYSRANDAQPTTITGGGTYGNGGPITGIRFLFESGNIASGGFGLYGLVKS